MSGICDNRDPDHFWTLSTSAYVTVDLATYRNYLNEHLNNMVCYPGCYCLAGGTSVTTRTGVKNIEDLCPGDKLLTSAKRREGGSSLKWSKFYAWGHRESDTVAEFVVLTFGNSSKELVISSQHLVFVAKNGGAGPVAKKAGEVCIGDKLFHFNGKGDGEEQLLSVIEITTRASRGVYAPFTMSGDFLANGFLVGCYANVESFEVAHAALAPLRMWHKLRGSKEMGSKSPKNGIHEYATNLMKIRDLLPVHLQQKVN